MKVVRFHTQIGSDRTIRIPEGTEVAAGQAEVIVLQPEAQPPVNGTQPEEPREHLFDKLAGIAKELSATGDLPADLAHNHDHYLHGLPKGIDDQ